MLPCEVVSIADRRPVFRLHEELSHQQSCTSCDIVSEVRDDDGAEIDMR